MSSFTLTSEDAFQSPPPAAPPARPRRNARQVHPSQKYDLAGTGVNDRNHWSKADALSASAAHTPDVLFRLRTRSRYETANNGCVLGLVRGRANDCIGTGPRLQIRIPETYFDPDFQRTVSVDPKLAAVLSRVVEELWCEWADGIGLVDKLHLADRSETREGEVFGVADTNPNAEPNTPTLDLRLYEADQCGDPMMNVDPDVISGVRVDGAGRPVAYHFYRQHPGDLFNVAFGPLDGEWVPAGSVFHLFDPDRVGQVHGVPALTPGLPLGAVLRRYTNASVGTAELQASIPATMEADYDLPDDDDEGGGDVTDMQQIPFAHTVILVTPAGRKVKAFPATQPAPNYGEFKAANETDIGRGIGAPRNVSTGSSADYNYSSGRLDHLPYQRGHVIRRDRFRRVLLDRLFKLWYAEASLIGGYLPQGLPPLKVWKRRWQWDAFASIDPVKDATANEIKLRTGQTTLDDVCSEQGKDWEEVLEQQARERDKRIELGLPDPVAAAAPATPPGNPQPDQPDDGEEVAGGA